jgi:RNA polymerase sigma-70 factor (sigma-E family)
VARLGNVRDFEEFAVGAMPGLLRFGHLLTGDPVRGEELVQQALVSSWLRWGAIRHDQPHAYVRRAMVHAHTSWWRRSRRECALPQGYDAVARPEADFGERDRAFTALRQLPPRQRAVVVLRYYEDLSEAEIAEALGCSRGTVKSHTARAMKTLRTQLSADLEASTP